MTTAVPDPTPNAAPENPAPRPGLPLGALLGGIATLLTIGVASSQLILNSLQIREKAQALPVTATVDPPASGAVPPQPEITDLPATADTSASTAADSEQPSGWYTYPPIGGAKVPAALEPSVHRLYVALEKGIRNARDFTYLVYVADTTVLRQIRKPEKVGTALSLDPAWPSAHPTPTVTWTPSLWNTLQQQGTGQVVFVACVCQSEPCAAPVIEWDMLRKALSGSGIQVTSAEWDLGVMTLPVTVMSPDGTPCTIGGPLILALVPTAGE